LVVLPESGALPGQFVRGSGPEILIVNVTIELGIAARFNLSGPGRRGCDEVGKVRSVGIL
jgi:hypothetical protein